MAVDPRYTELELSAVQEIANIGTGNAATALGMLVGRQIDIGVPAIELVPLAEAAERIGPLESTVAAVLTPVRGDAPASLLLALPMASADVLCGLLGTDAASELGHSCLQEVGNILTGSYIDRAGRPDRPGARAGAAAARRSTCWARWSTPCSRCPPPMQTPSCSSRPRSASRAAECSFGFLFVPQDAAVDTLLRALGRGMSGDAAHGAHGGAGGIREPGDVLVSLGLGSCIGLALVDESVGVAGLVHIVLPASPAVRRAGRRPSSPTRRYRR